MPDESIPPALTAEEWREVLDPNNDDDYMGEDGPLTGIGIGYTNGRLRTGPLCNPYPPAQLIALLNHALPDSDRRKITREWVRRLRATAEQYAFEFPSDGNAEALLAIADALESYLPPEG